MFKRVGCASCFEQQCYGLSSLLPDSLRAAILPLEAKHEGCEQSHKTKAFNQTLQLGMEMQARPLETRERKERSVKTSKLRRRY